MTSKEANLQNPATSLDIDLREVIAPEYHAYPCTFEEYKNMAHHDERTYYVIINRTDCIYLGDVLITTTEMTSHYFLGFNNDTGEYVIYQNMRSNWHDHLVEIARFADPESAMNALVEYNRGIDKDTVRRNIYLALSAYVKSEANLHQTIMQCISAAGYQDDPRMQELMQFGSLHMAENTDKDIPPIMRAYLHNMARERRDSLYPVYSTLYDVMVKYDYLKDHVYDGDDAIDYVRYQPIIDDIYRVLK